jgi:hypothetical protein
MVYVVAALAHYEIKKARATGKRVEVDGLYDGVDVLTAFL